MSKYLFIFLFIATANLFAQSRFGPQVGVNAYSYLLVDDTDKVDYKGKINTSIGFKVESVINKKLDYSFELAFGSSNYSWEFLTAQSIKHKDGSFSVVDKYSLKYTQYIIQPALGIKYDFFQRDKNLFLIETGVFSNILITQKNNDANDHFSDANFGFYNSFIFGYQFSLGYERKIGKQTSIRLAPYFGLFLTDVHVSIPGQRPFLCGSKVTYIFVPRKKGF